MDLNTLIAECTAYDYKESLEEKKPKSWLKSVSAFANTMGGSLFFGIDNDGNVKGLEDIQHVTETISMKIRDYMDGGKACAATEGEGGLVHSVLLCG